MRRLKCLSLVLLSGVLSLFLPSILLVKNANAQNLYQTYIRNWSTESQIFAGISPNFYTGTDGSLYLTYPSGQPITYQAITSLKLCTADTRGFPQNSLVYFTITYYDATGANPIYTPLALTSMEPYYAVEDVELGEYGRANYVIYINESISSPPSCLKFSVTGTNSFFGAYTRIDIGRPNGITLQNGATSSQINTIAQSINSIIAQNNQVINQNGQIIDILNTIDVEEVAEELQDMNNKDDQDRNNINDQQTDIDGDSEDSSEDIGNATTNISGVISTFLGNLNNLRAGSCSLPEISAYGFSLGQLNLCTYSPPSWIQNIATAVISLMILGLAIHLFKRIMGIAKGLAGSK